MKNFRQILLTFGIGVCVLYSLVRATEFIASRIPPYKVDQCLQSQQIGPLLQFKVVENHFIKGYSDLLVQSIFLSKDAVIKATFEELRQDKDIVKANCF